mgnify:FL=1
MSYKQRDIQLEHMGFKSYKEYLKSNLWEAIRSKKMCEQKKCLLCNHNIEDNLIIHHYDYSRDTLEGKTLNALIVLCKRCHSSIEFFIKDGEPIKRTLKLSLIHI